MYKKCFCSFKMIGITAILAAIAILFAGCADGNGGPSTPTSNAIEIQVEISAQNLRLIDDEQDTVVITLRTIPPLTTIPQLGSADTITIPITIEGDAASRVRIAENGGNFEAIPDEGVKTLLSATAAASKTITLRVISDERDENDSFTVQIGTPALGGKLADTNDYTIEVVGASGTDLSNDNTLTVTVIDSERATVDAQFNPASLEEGETGSLLLTFNKPPSGNTTMTTVTAAVGDNVPLTLDGAKTVMKSLNSITTTALISIESEENYVNGADVNYPITITATGGVEVVNSMPTLKVTDDDIPQLSITATKKTVSEGENAGFTIAATIEPYRDITIRYIIKETGGATEADYDDTHNGMVTMTGGTMALGTRTVAISIEITDDSRADEAGEGFTVTIIPPDGTMVDNTMSSAAIIIFDNDSPDLDGDEVDDSEDIDDDNDGLIEVHTLAQLNSMRYNAAGTSYKGSATTTAVTTGAPIVPTANCKTSTTDGVYLCGYELMSDLDFDTSGYEGTFTKSGTTTNITATGDPQDTYYNGGAGWDPICETDTDTGNCEPFSGIFEGNNHTISNLYINYQSGSVRNGTGLFGHASNRIQNVTLDNIYVQSSVDGDGNIGGLVGKGDIDLIIENCNVSGTVQSAKIEGTSNTGGILGINGTIISSRFQGTVIGANDVGGLVGKTESSSPLQRIIASHVIGGGDDIIQGIHVGGLIGRSHSDILASYVKNINIESAAIQPVSGYGHVGGLIGLHGGWLGASYSDSDVTVNGNDNVVGLRIGGLVGYSNVGIIASYSKSAVNGSNAASTGENNGELIGGLVGQIDGGALIDGSYATGHVKEKDGDWGRVGGLVGYQSGGRIRTSYAIGNAYGGAGNNDRVGGLVGYQVGGTVIASYATGISDGGAGTGDYAGSLLGNNNGSMQASFGFGVRAGHENTDSYGSPTPIGVMSAAALTAENAMGCNPNTTLTRTQCEALSWNTWSAWSVNSGISNDNISGDGWDYGNTIQPPALVFADTYGHSLAGHCHVDRDDNGNPIPPDTRSIPDYFADGTAITCAQPFTGSANGSLIPGQR